ncbi:hypothetical protein AVEN_122110-1 [Araneus ventricosus]|uniref:Uncharacterized protein n=1 Tax=Araneus ventricosus TaxID=182803 RepID=A0A4Y2P367_ARAVE|nr:hypothetical protein AVEN_122110-1 [Araneus ventricosus]
MRSDDILNVMYRENFPRFSQSACAQRYFNSEKAMQGNQIRRQIAFAELRSATSSVGSRRKKLLDDHVKGRGIIGRHEIKTLSPLPIPVITVSFMTFGSRCVIFNRVALRSLGISRLHISSTGTPTFNLGLSEGAPDNSEMLKKKNDDEKNPTKYDVPC